MLQDNANDDLKRDVNGAFTFATSVASGAAYKVTIMTQPVGGPANEKCTITAATDSGTVAGANFYTVPVVGSMTDTNVRAACLAAGFNCSLCWTKWLSMECG